MGNIALVLILIFYRRKYMSYTLKFSYLKNIFIKCGRSAILAMLIFLISFQYLGSEAANLPHENGTWKTLAPMSIGRHDTEAVAYKGKFYLISGGGDLTSDLVEIYDPATNTWSKGAPIPESRGWFGSALIDGKVYCFGGKCIRTDEEKQTSGTNEYYKFRWSLNIYDITANKWTVGSHMHFPRAGVHGTAIDGKVWAPGGWISAGADSYTFDVVEFYDPKTDKWLLSDPLPEERYASAVAAVGDKLYISGGCYRGPKNIIQGERSEIFIYDIKTRKWSTGKPMPTPRRDHAAVVIGKRIYYIGGVTINAAYVKAVEIYDTEKNTWSTATPLPIAKAWMGVGVIDGKIYVAGGANSTPGINGFKWLNDFYVYEPPAR
jgi:N-acetylneuraminic acid mutarotase